MSMEENPLRQPLHPDIDEAMIRELVHAFYAQVRADADLGPIFAAAIGDNWDPHLEKMCDFWSSVMLRTGRYKGNPMTMHLRQKAIRPPHFVRWLDLFRQTARQRTPAPIADLFIDRAETIARSLEMGMFFRPGARP